MISTCNVQHLESVADAVATITGAPVNERLPDDVLAAADEVELVDMSPHALRQRMRHGNVYPPERTEVALDRFFTEPNLTALREIALRFVAQTVDEQLAEIGPGGLGTRSTVTERIAVAVDEIRRPAGPRSGGARSWPAPSTFPSWRSSSRRRPSEHRAFDRERDLRENLDYADDLGAEIIRVEASQLADGLIESSAGAGRPTSCWPTTSRAWSPGSVGRRSPTRSSAPCPTVEVHLVAGDPPPQLTPVRLSLGAANRSDRRAASRG